MLSWCSVLENKAHEVVLQDNDQSSRALETTPYTRSERKGVCVALELQQSGPQHAEVRVEEQKIHDVRKTRIREHSQPAEIRGTVNDAVKTLSWLWSTRHGPQSCILR